MGAENKKEHMSYIRITNVPKLLKNQLATIAINKRLPLSSLLRSELRKLVSTEKAAAATPKQL